MKVYYQGTKRKIGKWPLDMDDFRRVVYRKFGEKALNDTDSFAEMPSQNPLAFDDGLPAVSLYQDGQENEQSMQSILDGSDDGLKNLLDDNLASRREKKKAQAAITQKIDWLQVTCFYEDSEGDLNVISEDEDISDAHMYY